MNFQSIQWVYLKSTLDSHEQNAIHFRQKFVGVGFANKMQFDVVTF